MTNTTNTAAASGAAILFEHEDGRYAVNPNTTGDPAWHRLGPVDVSAIAAEPAQPVAQEGGTLVTLIEKKIAGMSPSEVAAFMAARAALAASGNDQAAPDMRDPYGGAREDLAIWRKRALEAEALNRKFATSVNGPTFMGEPADSDSALMAREIHESQEDTLLICASDLQHSAIYDNHVEMQSCMRAVADRITALASVIEGVERAALAARAQAVPAPGVPSEQQAHDMGAKGAPATEAERLLFEAWMRGHCWALCATWEGTGYRSAAERGGGNDPHAMATRRLWAAWRDRAALAASPTAATATAAPAPARCKSCGTHEVSQQQTCHNSGCAVYAQDVTIYEGWKSHTPASSPCQDGWIF